MRADDPFFTSTMLATRLPLFPRLKLNMSSGFSCDLAHEVLAGELDLALVIEPPDSGMLTGLKIDESPFYVVMSQDDELANHPSLSLDQLGGKRWVAIDLGYESGGSFVTMFRKTLGTSPGRYMTERAYKE